MGEGCTNTVYEKGWPLTYTSYKPNISGVVGPQLTEGDQFQINLILK